MMLLCVGVTFGCVSDQETNVPLETSTNILVEESEIVQASNQEEEQESSLQEESQEETTQEEYFPEKQMEQNEKMFYEEAKKQGYDKQAAEKYFQILMEDNLFRKERWHLQDFR